MEREKIIDLLQRNQFILLEVIYYYKNDDTIYSLVFNKNSLVIIVDVNICRVNDEIFSYYNYVNKQNYYMNNYECVYRFYISDENDIEEFILTLKLLTENYEDYEIKDQVSARDTTYIDNSPVEYHFEQMFSKVYGIDSLKFLEKEYSLTTLNGTTLYSDYVLETTTSKYAIEENGVTYHHPQIIKEEKYKLQLEKQNSLMYYKFKVFRWSSEHISFPDAMEDNIKEFFGNKENFISKFSINQNRRFELYEHQVDYLKAIEDSRQNGINAFLIVLPTAAGKSEIAIENVKRLYIEKHNLNVLIISPTTQLKNDWENRIREYANKINFSNLTYVGAHKLINRLPSTYFDYIIIDEAHHAVTPTCRKIIKYFNPSFMLGLTATPERLDKKRLEEVFGSYDVKLDLKEAIKKNIISPIRVFRVESNINLSEVRYNGVDYRNSDIEKLIRVDSRNELIAKVLRKYFANNVLHKKQGIIFCVNINHAKEMAKVCSRHGIRAEAVYGGNKKNDEIISRFRNKEIQFLCSCNLISEGWDEPSVEVVVMARPTLSKVLYLQQLGRGLRKHKDKEALYVIDVVDQYGMLLKPWTVHSIFNINLYKPFADILNINATTTELTTIQGLVEHEIAIKEIDIDTFEENYKDYLSVEQLARELFVSTGTVSSWIKKKEIVPEVSYFINKSRICLFSLSQVEEIRNLKGLKVRNEQTIKEDFFEFISEKSFTFSFKIIFLLSLLKVINNEGEADVADVVNLYKRYYLTRIDNNLPVDKKNCVYTRDYLNDEVKIKRSLFENPFEKFERKRFVYHSKDLNKIMINPILWNQLKKEDIEYIRATYASHLKDYYKNYQGIGNIDFLM